jgi:hypothetical protein
MSKYPEIVRLFVELHGGTVEWWEPITDRLYRVKLVGEENERIVRQSGSELLTWGKKK